MKNERPLMIFSGNSNRKLAEDVANYLNISVGKASVTTFRDGEISVEIQKSDDPALPGGESFSSAKLTTQDLFEFKHGRVDIRAVVAEGKGFWSAGWMLGANFDDIGWPF